MTATQFQTAYPHWTTLALNPSVVDRIQDISVLEFIPIANALQINVKYTNNTSQSGYIPASSSGFSNNYITFSIGNGSTLFSTQ